MRQHAEKRKELFIDERIKRRIKRVDIADVDRSKWWGIDVVAVPERQVRKEEYVVNSKEFKVVEVVGRVYKPSLQRERVHHNRGGNAGIGIGGYIVRCADGHEFCVLSSSLDVLLGQLANR